MLLIRLNLAISKSLWDKLNDPHRSWFHAYVIAVRLVLIMVIGLQLVSMKKKIWCEVESSQLGLYCATSCSHATFLTMTLPHPTFRNFVDLTLTDYRSSAQFSGASLESHIDAQCVEWRAPGFRLYFNKAGDPFRSFSLLVSHWVTIVIAFLLLLSEIAVRFSRRSRLRESEGFSRATNVG